MIPTRRKITVFGMQHGLSAVAVLMAAMLCSLWGYGGTKNQGEAVTAPLPPMSMHQGMDQTVNNESTELVALDAGARTPWAGDDRQQAQALFASLKQRGIVVQSTFYKMLGLATPSQRGKLVSRCYQFFNSVDTQEISNTGSLTGMIKNKTQIDAFLAHSDDSIRGIATIPALRSLASLFNGRGFPQAEQDTRAFINWEFWWQGEGSGRTLDRTLLRTFSSMLARKGIPDKKAVDDYLQLDIWWKKDGNVPILDRELLRIFSSMFNGRGLPDKQSVKAYLQWDIWWQGEGQTRALDRELLHTFSSMFHGRGLPNKEAVDNYLNWGIWWQGQGEVRRLDRELLRTFSSMFNRRGLPDKRSVDEYLQWEIWWQGNGQARTLDRELLRTFSSMFCGRGLPDKKAVDDYLQLDVWYQKTGPGGTLDRELLRTFSSMFNGRGLPDKQAVEGYLQWPLWCRREGDVCILDRDMLRIFSSMFHGKGLPDKKTVDNYLTWEIWRQGKGKARTLDERLLRSASSMFHGRGLPKKLHTDQIVQWLTRDEQLDRQAFEIMVNLYSGAYTGHTALGFPDINKLRKAEQKLTALIFPGEQAGHEDNDILPLIKRVALYLANDGGTQQLRWSDCAAWLREHPSPLWKKFVLRQLLLTLHYHGGRGIKEAVTLISGQPVATKWFVLGALGSRQTLASVQYALQSIKATDWWEYLFFTKELCLVPSDPRWQTIKNYLEALAPVLPHKGYRHRFLTLIWPFPPAERERFVQPEVVDRLTTLLPSVQVIRKLSNGLTTDEVRTLFDTFLAYQADWPDKRGLPILFKALLLAQRPLWDRGFDLGPLSPGVLAQTSDHPEGVVIGVDPAAGVEDVVTLFIRVMAVLVGALWGSDYIVDGQTLTLWPRGETVPITLPTPYLTWHSDGVQICDWTLAHLHRFGQATRCPGLCREPTDLRGCAPHAYQYPSSSHLPVIWLDRVLGQTVLNQVELDRLYSYRDQLTLDHVIDILLRMDQNVSQDTAQQWQLLLGEKHQQSSQIDFPWLEVGDEIRETVHDCEDMFKDLFPDVG